MEENTKAVLRLRNGAVIKGYLNGFSPDLPEVVITEEGMTASHAIKIEEIKAVFFVRSFEGQSEYKEKKSYGTTKLKGNRVFVKFKDGESFVGFLDGEVPWNKGFFLSKRHDGFGFYLYPVDEEANNLKIFVVAASVDDVTVVP